MKKFLGILLSLMMIVGATAAMAEFDYTQDITVVSREDGSGTRSAFIELLGVEKEDGKRRGKWTTPPRKPSSPTVPT